MCQIHHGTSDSVWTVRTPENVEIVWVEWKCIGAPPHIVLKNCTFVERQSHAFATLQNSGNPTAIAYRLFKDNSVTQYCSLIIIKQFLQWMMKHTSIWTDLWTSKIPLHPVELHFSAVFGVKMSSDFTVWRCCTKFCYCHWQALQRYNTTLSVSSNSTT